MIKVDGFFVGRLFFSSSRHFVDCRDIGFGVGL